MLRQVLRRLRNDRQKNKNRTAARAAFRRGLSVELLEDRRVLTGGIEWLDQFGASSGRAASDTGSAVTAADGFVYEVSTLGSQAAGQTSAGSFDAFVRKLDDSGKEIWTRQFGTPSGDEAIAVAVDATGVYVSGITQGSFPGFTNAGGRDAFVAKFNLNGDLQWVDQFGAAGIDFVKGVTTLDGFIYATGYVDSWGNASGRRGRVYSQVFSKWGGPMDRAIRNGGFRHSGWHFEPRPTNLHNGKHQRWFCWAAESCR